MSISPTLDTTIGGTSSNAFITVAESDSYHTGRFHNRDGWFAKTIADKQSLIVWATRMLDRLEWEGSRVDEDQKLSWPRNGLEDDGISIQSDELPERLKEATSELAYWLGQSDRMAPETGAITKKINVGSISLEFDTDKGDAYPIPKEVMSLIQNWAKQPAQQSSSVRLVRT